MDYLEDNVLAKGQVGFRKALRATGPHFHLKETHRPNHKHKARSTLCCFVDLQKAFDNVWHKALMPKIAQNRGTRKKFSNYQR